MDRRKRRIAVILCLISIMCLSACGKTGTNQERETASYDGNGITTDGNRVNLNYFFGEGKVTEAPSGYYVYDINNMVTYVDEISGNSTYLCARADCTHIDEKQKAVISCDAYMGESIIPDSMHYAEGKLYYIQYNQSTFSAVLCCMGMDGSNHTKLYDLESLPTCANYIRYIVSGDYIYYSYLQESQDIEVESKVDVISLNLKTGTKETLYSANGYGIGIINLKIYGNCLYYGKNFMETADGEYKHSCERINLDTKEHAVLVDSIIEGYAINEKDNSLLYWVRDEGLYRLDYGSGMTSLLAKSEDNYKRMSIACDNEYIYLSNYNDYAYDEVDFVTFLVYDLSGKCIAEVKSPDNMHHLNPLFVSEHNVYARVLSPDSKSELAYIQKDALLNGNGEWKFAE